MSGSHLSSTIDVLDLLRIASIECVEAIVTWCRKQQHRQERQELSSSSPQFYWNHINYLLKMPSDLDFLEKHTGLIQWLGFTLVRNPFILPINLDARRQLEPSASHSTPLAPSLGSQFVQIGGKREPMIRSENNAAQIHAAALAERKRAKNPYETRVVNDEELVPFVRPSVEVPVKPVRHHSHELILPSQIGDLDMSRIRMCEDHVLEEERLFGKFTYDIYHRLVPQEEAQRRQNMVEMSGDAYPHESEPVATTSLLPNATLHAKKKAGMLGSISKPQCMYLTKSCTYDLTVL